MAETTVRRHVKDDDDFWVRLYAYAMKHTGALKTGQFLTVEAMMAKLGIIADEGLKEGEKRLLSQLQSTVGCFSYDENSVKTGTDILGGMIRQGDTILCSDLGYVTKSTSRTSTDSDGMAEGERHPDNSFILHRSEGTI